MRAIADLLNLILSLSKDEVHAPQDDR